MKTVNIHEAKTHLSRLLERVSKGEKIVIGKAGKPIAKLIPFTEPENTGQPPRKLGQWEGQILVTPAWDEPDSALEGLFHDGPLFPDEKP